MKSNDVGPIYGVRLIEELPLGKGGIIQEMPSSDDLKKVQRISERTVAGFEVLTEHYRSKCNMVSSLRSVIERVIAGEWSVTELQDVLGNLGD